MVNLFRRLLIRVGKVTPFLLAFIILVSCIENINSILTNRIATDEYGMMYYYCPIGAWLSDIIYIDWLDVLLVWILCFALELCKYSFRCAYLITLNLPFRWLVENYETTDNVIITCSFIMTLLSLLCLYGGVKVIKRLN